MRLNTLVLGVAMLTGCVQTTHVIRRTPIWATRGVVAATPLEAKWTHEGGRVVGRLAPPGQCHAADLQWYQDERIETVEPDHRPALGFMAFGGALMALGAGVYAVESSIDDDPKLGSLSAFVGSLGLAVILYSAVGLGLNSAFAEESTTVTPLPNASEVVRTLPQVVPCGGVSLDGLELVVERIGATEFEPTELARVRPRNGRVELPPFDGGPGRLRVRVLEAPGALTHLSKPGSLLLDQPIERLLVPGFALGDGEAPGE